MTNREELLTLVAAAMQGQLASPDAADKGVEGIARWSMSYATAALKAMDEVSATVNASQVDSSKDAEIARLLDACLRWEKDFGILKNQFRDYRERMESPLTDEEAKVVAELYFGTMVGSNSIGRAHEWDAAIRKVREGRKP